MDLRIAYFAMALFVQLSYFEQPLYESWASPKTWYALLKASCFLIKTYGVKPTISNRIAPNDLLNRLNLTLNVFHFEILATL